VSDSSKSESPNPASRPGSMSRPSPEGKGRAPRPLRPDPLGPGPRDGCRRGRGCGEGSGERARAPLGWPSKKWWDAARPGSVSPRSAPLRRGARHTFVLPESRTGPRLGQ
jgi:hypothetical protein